MLEEPVLNDKEWKEDNLDPISPTFCAAKWLNSTIWLGSGQTTSCHHPPAHAIDLEALATNPKALHNTAQKKEDRRLMQNGDRPAGCDYCWKVEDLKGDQISDRVYKSKIYEPDDLMDAYDTKYFEDVNLKTLEISFDRTCNFACSYCNPAFSTTWAKDIKDNGPYTGLTSDGRNHFTHEHKAAQPYKVQEPNPYVEAFWKWWESDLKYSLQELRITGGEPLMSAEFWKLLDEYGFKVGGENLTSAPIFGLPRLAVNSNLGCSQELFQKLVDKSFSVAEFDLYTSCEATFAEAEYIRDGLDFDIWLERVDTLLSDADFREIHVMCTINALSLFSLTKLLDMMLMLKAKHGERSPNFTLNILRFPSFQSCLVLPDSIRKQRRQDLQMWLWKNIGNELLHQHELDHVARLIDYLNEPETDDIKSLRNDFKQFYTQYDERRGKSFEDTFPNELVQWYQTL